MRKKLSSLKKLPNDKTRIKKIMIFFLQIFVFYVTKYFEYIQLWLRGGNKTIIP